MVQHTHKTVPSPNRQQKPAKGVAINDNRPQAAIQKKQVAGMQGKQPASIPLQKKANNTGLPDQLKSGIENLSGVSMNDVKVHYNSAQPAAVQAHAYAQGTDIHVAPGQEKHLPHEAWHVVQQKQGRVKPTKQLKSKISINDDKGLETEADTMGAKAIQAKHNDEDDETHAAESTTGSAPVLQGVFVLDNGTPVTAKGNFDKIVPQIESHLKWNAHNMDDLEWFDTDARTEILNPKRHVIGENHNQSHFDELRQKWPQAAAMAEGVHLAEEHNLQLPASQAHASHDIFNNIAHQINNIIEPLENFHAANMVRLALFLTQWNEQHAVPHNFSWINNPNRKRLIPESASIANQYATLASGVYVRAVANEKFYHFSPQYATATERLYGQLFDMAKGERALRALTLMNTFRDQVNGNVSPAPSDQQYDDVKWYVIQMLGSVKDILVTSVGLGSNNQAVIQGANTFGTYLTQNAGTMRDAQVPAVLASGNAPREQVMAGRIGNLPRPGLVKVGAAHIAGLQQLNIPDTVYYNNWQEFNNQTEINLDGLQG